MKKNVLVLVPLLALLLSSCQGLFTPTPPVDSAATSDALFKTAVAQTLTARPTLPPDLLTETATLPVETPVVPATDTLPATEDFATPVDLTATPITATFDPVTATSGPADVTPAATETATLAVGQVTPTWTLAVRLYGTLPPAVPFSKITLTNKARAEAYISLQVTMPDGKYSILEYPVQGSIAIQAPVGSYLYVAWVGGRKMVGEFRLKHDDDLSITLFKDRVTIR